MFSVSVPPIFFRPFGSQFDLKIRGAGPPGPSPGSATRVAKDHNMVHFYLPFASSSPGGICLLNSLKRFFHACRPGSHFFRNCLHFGLILSSRMRFSSVKPNSFSILSLSFLIFCCFSFCFESSPTSPPFNIRQRIFESLFCRKCFEIHNDLSISIKLLPNTYFGKKIKKSCY